MKSWLPHAGTVLQYKDNFQLVKRNGLRMVLLLQISTPCKVQAEWPRMDVIVLTLVLKQNDSMSVFNFGYNTTYHQFRVRRSLSIFKDVLLRTKRALSLYKVYGDSALLVLNRTSLNSESALLALNWQCFLCVCVCVCVCGGGGRGVLWWLK